MNWTMSSIDSEIKTDKDAYNHIKHKATDLNHIHDL